MAQEVVSKAQLLDGLRSSGRDIVEKLSPLPDGTFESGCYENGWNARQVLAHVAAIEWSYPRLLDVARGTEAQASGASAGLAQPASRPAQGGIDSYNQRQIERYADASVAELLEVFRKNRATTIDAVEQADDGLFETPIKSAGGVTGPLGTVMNYVAVMHVRVHLGDILQAAGRA